MVSIAGLLFADILLGLVIRYDKSFCIITVRVQQRLYLLS